MIPPGCGALPNRAHIVSAEKILTEVVKQRKQSVAYATLFVTREAF
jgi:hypothetical protein